MFINLKTLVLALPLALALMACQTVPITEASRTTFAEPSVQNGMLRVGNFHIPKDEPGAKLTHFLIGSPYLNESFAVSIFDITGETRYLGTLFTGSSRRPVFYQQWLEHEFPAGKRTFMLAAGVNGIGTHHTDFIEIDVKAGEVSHVALSRYGFLTYPYLGEVQISATDRKFCEALTGKPGEREKAALAHMAASGIDLLGSGDIDATGNALDNVLVGNSGANRLDGGFGADVMIGGGGNDVYVVDNAGDVVFEAAGGGDELVLSSVSYTLADHVERLTLTGTADIDGTGNELNNVLIGNAGRNVLDGGAGVDAMAGGAGDDDYIVDNAADTVFEAFDSGIDTIYSSVSYVLPEHVENLTLTGNDNTGAIGNALDNRLVGNGADNLLSGGGGDDMLDGGNGNDTLEGGQGNDLLIGGEGDDTYLINLGDGLDRIEDESGMDTVQFGAGLSLDNVALRVTWADGVHTAHVRVLNAGGCEQPDQGFDFAVTLDDQGRYVSPIDAFRFADGSVSTFDDLLIKTVTTYGSAKTLEIATGRDDDIIYAGPRNNVIRSGSGHDIVFAGAGGDSVAGEGGDDYLQGGTGDDSFDGGCGMDVLAGSYGYDFLRDAGGNNALFGGLQDDTIEAGGGSDFIAGGKHDDVISVGAGHNVIAFNGGDGRDTVLGREGAVNTLSLGGGIGESGLSFRKSGQNLILETGGAGQLTFKDWYASAANQNFVTLQLIESVSATAAPSGWNIERFDFKALVQAFDAAQAANPKLSKWSLMNSLLDAHLESSDTMALGGELAARYAAGGETALTLETAQNTLRDAQFGAEAQAVGSRFNAAVGSYRIA